MDERISEEDLNLVKEAQTRVTSARDQFDKANLVKQLVETQLDKLVLELFAKYEIKNGVDQLMADGKIVRGEKPETLTINPEYEEVAEEKSESKRRTRKS